MDKGWKGFIEGLLNEESRNNPIMQAIIAGTMAMLLILFTPAFAPIGVVGATGWIVVYCVSAGIFSCSVASRILRFYIKSDKGKREEWDYKFEMLRKAKQEGAITKEEFDAAVDKLLKEMGAKH